MAEVPQQFCSESFTRTLKLFIRTSRFFSSMIPSLETHSDTYRTFSNLQNDFIPETQVEDPLHEDKVEDIEEFLNAVLHTNISVIAHRFLNELSMV
jgi:hypothetical protein